MEDTKKDNDRIVDAEKEWNDKVVKPALKRFNLEANPQKFYTPRDVKNFDFLEKVGFPGSYPYTAGSYAFLPLQAGQKGGGHIPSGPGMKRAGRYSGFGTSEDYRDYHKQMQAMGAKGGPNIAFDLPTQCGYDSDSDQASGEVGKVGVCVDTLRDFETIYEAFTGENDIDRIASNFTINAPANIIIAMYVALAEKRGIPMEKLRATPQNDILKEYIGRGTYIFPPEHSMRMVRDSIVFFTKYLPHVNINSIGGYHMREAGCTRNQDLAFSMANAAAYFQLGIDAGLDIDSFAPKFTFNSFGGSMEFYDEVAFQRAARRMWAKLLKNRFGAKNPRSMLIRLPMGANMGFSNTTIQRPLNNLTRSVVGAMAAAMSGSAPNAQPPFDEALGLGWSMEAIQLSEDAGRILQLEAKLCDVADPFAGSYFMEALTDEIEEAAWEGLNKIDSLGGAAAAIEYMRGEVAKSAYERQQRIEAGEDLIIGVNCYTGDNEIEVSVNRSVEHPYDATKREMAEQHQLARLAEVKRTRNSKDVTRHLGELESAAKNEETNLLPIIIECVKSYATIQEICDVLRNIFGEYKASSI
ncbi:MAG: methylmalonyl-CoA mutase [Syntrophobacterales bacterium]|nr:methylmalonyl-CoA mutase [Syntrophobacterales bacterium]